MSGKPKGPAIVRDCLHGGRHEHGTVARYKDDACRCQECRAAVAAEFRRRARLIAYGQLLPAYVDATGSRRRLQALGRIGWSPLAISGECGLFRTHLQRVRCGEATKITRATADAVSAVYDRLWQATPPRATGYQEAAERRARAHAEAQGWPPPLAWDDDELDDPAAVPVPVGEQSSWDLAPCGTIAAERRHYRRGEPIDEACRNAAKRYAAERRAVRGTAA